MGRNNLHTKELHIFKDVFFMAPLSTFVRVAIFGIFDGVICCTIRKNTGEAGFRNERYCEAIV